MPAPPACLQRAPCPAAWVGAVSGLLHPVGPESVHLYWARRALVFGAAAALAVAAALIIYGTSSGSEAQQPNQQAAAYSVDSPTAGAGPAKLHARGKAESVDKVFVPENGPGTYQTAKKSGGSTSSDGALIRYDVRVEDGLPIDPNKAALLIQGVLDDPRSWRATAAGGLSWCRSGSRPHCTPTS